MIDRHHRAHGGASPNRVAGDASDHRELRPIARADAVERDVVVVEVGPRDGLQSEPGRVPTMTKIAFIEALATAGLPVVESTSFVNPDRVPQLSDATDVMRGIRRNPGVRYPVLVPNERGFQRALTAGVDAIAMFTAATEAFAGANVGATIDETFGRFEPIAHAARARDIWMRGYVSVAFGCPYSGSVRSAAVARVSERLLAMGCAEICLADTIGAATPETVHDVVWNTRNAVPLERIALHFHDTSGNALANVDAGLSLGVRIFDAATGGLGGCPFAPGAPGNLATEHLVNYLEESGFRTGVHVERLRGARAVLAPHVPSLEQFSA